MVRCSKIWCGVTAAPPAGSGHHLDAEIESPPSSKKLSDPHAARRPGFPPRCDEGLFDRSARRGIGFRTAPGKAVWAGRRGGPPCRSRSAAVHLGTRRQPAPCNPEGSRQQLAAPPLLVCPLDHRQISHQALVPSWLLPAPPPRPGAPRNGARARPRFRPARCESAHLDLMIDSAQVSISPAWR